MRGYRPLGRGKRRGGPDPVLLFGAAVCGSPSANDPGAEEVSEGPAHLRATPREDERKSSAQKEPTLTSEAILLLGIRVERTVADCTRNIYQEFKVGNRHT